MGDVTALHAHAKRLILGLRDGLGRLEAAEGVPRAGDPAALASELRAQFSVLQRTSTELESVWRMHVIRESSSKRDVWKRKVEQVTEEVYALQISLDKFGSREQRRQAEKQEREELLSRAADGRKAKEEMDAESQLTATGQRFADGDAKQPADEAHKPAPADEMAGSVTRSKRALEEIYQSGSNILVSMAGSRERLKRAHRRVLDVINSVGLGETLLKLIEKRQRMDIWITYGGMVVVLLLVVLLLWWAWS